MSAIANIVVFDGAATPVSHTLIPVSVVRENGKITADWRENLPGIPVYAQVRCTMTLERLKSGVYKTSSRTVVPVMESVSGQNAAGYTAAPKVAYENSIEQIGFFHERSDSNGRKLVRQMALNIGGNVTTSVAPSSSGPFAELFDLLTAPN